jgi:hypothetical protein
VSRRVFVSYHHADQMKAKGFDLMRYNPALELEFTTRGLLDPVRSTNPAYIERCIKERQRGTSVTVVLINDATADSDWVRKEIRWSTEKRPPNGLVGILLGPDAPIPAGMEGAEFLNWEDPEDVREFGPAVERAATAARRLTIAAGQVGTDASGCQR